jgi:hypothetical protein
MLITLTPIRTRVPAYVALTVVGYPTPPGHPASEIFTGGKVLDRVATRQRLFGEKNAFVASGTHKNRETVTDHAHLAAFAFLQMREGVTRPRVSVEQY